MTTYRILRSIFPLDERRRSAFNLSLAYPDDLCVKNAYDLIMAEYFLYGKVQSELFSQVNNILDGIHLDDAHCLNYSRGLTKYPCLSDYPTLNGKLNFKNKSFHMYKSFRSVNAVYETQDSNVTISLNLKEKDLVCNVWMSKGFWSPRAFFKGISIWNELAFGMLQIADSKILKQFAKDFPKMSKTF